MNRIRLRASVENSRSCGGPVKKHSLSARPLSMAVFLAVCLHMAAATLYASPESLTPTPPYGSWETAASEIQRAVDAAAPGDEIVVTNGVYATGGRAIFGTMTNRVAVDKPVLLRSVNGPQFTLIQGANAPGGDNGDGAVRCVYLTEGATLSGFTLTNGATRTAGDLYQERTGGGVWRASTNAVLTNCVLAGNFGYQAGGAYGATLDDCLVIGNATPNDGGGAFVSRLFNCTLTGNQTGGSGAGAFESELSHCTLTNNTAQAGGGGGYFCTLDHCTLNGNSARQGGGGAFDGTLSNCIVSGNTAVFSSGGGVLMAKLYNCVLTDNSAYFGGGGASSCTLYNCTVTHNSTGYGGGVWNSSVYNCIVFFNQAHFGANYNSTSLQYSCATPLPDGPGNLSADPQLLTATHLSVTSPCIGAGNPTYAAGEDIDDHLGPTRRPWALISPAQPLARSASGSFRHLRTWSSAIPFYSRGLTPARFKKMSGILTMERS